MSDEPVEQRLVTSVGVSINHSGLGEHSQRVNDAVIAEILKCNAEGISTDEKNSVVIRERMQMAHDRELERIREEDERRSLLS